MGKKARKSSALEANAGSRVHTSATDPFPTWLRQRHPKVTNVPPERNVELRLKKKSVGKLGLSVLYKLQCGISLNHEGHEEEIYHMHVLIICC